MVEYTHDDLKDILPYEGQDVRDALERLSKYPELSVLSSFIFPTWEWSRFKDLFDSIRDVDTFQDELIAPAIKSVCGQTTAGVEIEGLEGLDPKKNYLFLGNHRDIVMDPAMLGFFLHAKGFGTPKVALGDNLLVNPWIADLIRLNKSLIVKRGLAGREMFKALWMLSITIHDQVSQRKDSVWLAQREGRSKDGIDRTAPAVLKMLAMSKPPTRPYGEFFAELNLTPMSISYEYDPCDMLKARERIRRERFGDEFKKKPNEDLESMLAGIRGRKGRVMIRVGKPADSSAEIWKTIAKISRKDQVFQELASFWDRQIAEQYELWPSHFIAFDLLQGASTYDDRYTAADKQAFEQRLEERLKYRPKDRETMRQYMLEGYANSVQYRLDLGLNF